MKRRLLITGAGTGASGNLMRSLRAGDPSLFLVGCHHDRFTLKLSSADRNYLTPAPKVPDFAAALRRIIRTEKIDLLIPSSDADVMLISRLRRRIPCRLFLPRRATIELCQDKYRLTAFLRSRGVPVPATYPVTGPKSIERVFRRMHSRSGAWCRMRAGYGAMGATPVKSPKQVRNWIRDWKEMQGIPATAFILSEYLPGRDFACQSLWNEGKHILVKTSERVSYLIPANLPSAASSVARLSKTVHEPRIVETCAQAIRALDRKATGVFSLDLKENAEGLPCVTEINAGRFSSGTNILDLTGKHNMAATYVRVALGEPVDFREEYDVAEDYYMLRDLDTSPGIFHAEELFEGIEEVWR
jgi:carbamoyl-phosphate synthase large subunit